MLSTNSLLWELPWVWQTRKGFALSSSVELSTDCTTVSSAVDSADAATPPLKVPVVSALDPEVIVVVEKRVPVVLVGRAYG